MIPFSLSDPADLTDDDLKKIDAAWEVMERTGRESERELARYARAAIANVMKARQVNSSPTFTPR